MTLRKARFKMLIADRNNKQKNKIILDDITMEKIANAR